MRPVIEAAIVTAVALLSGCAHSPSVSAPPGSNVELDSTPFFPQREYQCGPAALATVLTASGVNVMPDELIDKVYLPGRRGSLQVEMVATARGYDRVPYEIEPRLNEVFSAVEEGRPVLVLQNLGFKSVPVWHYAVVIGFDAASERVLLRSGTTERLKMSVRRFARSWNLAGSWAVVLLRPGEIPRDARPERFVAAVAGLEAAKRLAPALRSYEAADRRWPGQSIILLGIGNVYYAQGDLSAAADSYRRLAVLDPANAIALNNLAQVLLEQGRPEAALVEITRGRGALTDPRFAPTLDETENEIRRALRR